MSMSVEQSEFIRKLKIVLISVLGPFILTGIVVSITNHQRINSNEKHIEALERSSMSRAEVMAYMDGLRELNELLRLDLSSQEKSSEDQIAQVNIRLDKLMQDVYEVKKRGLPEAYNFE